MHWLLSDARTPRALEEAGYSYDSTVGYNETIGYRAGTGQVFRPLGTTTLLELPIHIQDGALFYPRNLDLSAEHAAVECEKMIMNARRFGGVLTLLWHDRSHAAERFWGDFYAGLVARLRRANVWFATGCDIVEWFRMRRAVRFEGRTANIDEALASHEGNPIHPPLIVRVYADPSRYTDVPWTGKASIDLHALTSIATARARFDTTTSTREVYSVQ
jgi:hypothetical protein